MSYAQVELKHPLGVRAIAARFVRMLPTFSRVSGLLCARDL